MVFDCIASRCDCSKLPSLAGPVIALFTLLVLGDACFSTETPTSEATIERQVEWSTSRVVGTPEPPRPYAAERVFPNLQFVNPVVVTQQPNLQRLFVVEQLGKIFSFPSDRDVLRPDLAVDVASIGGVTAVYGMEFHPRFADNRFVFICYVSPQRDPHGTSVSRFEVTELDPPRIDLATEQQIITWVSGGHNGGCLKFGHDRMLYISTGDATAPFPPDGLNTGQDNSDLLSAILRIDIDRAASGRAYSIPADNPFVALETERAEVWAYGFRNPWKMSFGPKGHLWVGDVGWELWEMIYRVKSGGNYGWSVMEGPQRVKPDDRIGPTPILPATAAHSHTEARSITGGMVYQGARLPELQHAYIYADYETGKIWALSMAGDEVTSIDEIADSTLRIVAFGEDYRGELFFAAHQGGGLYRLRRTTVDAGTPTFPQTLSATGIFRALSDLEPESGVYEYRLSVEPWMNGATAVRHVAVPGSASIDASSPLTWSFPAGTVLVKTLSMEMEVGNPASARRIETQLLHRGDDAEWRPYTYAWNENQTDARLVPASGEKVVLPIVDASSPHASTPRRFTWRFHNRTLCLICHNTFSHSVLGLNSRRLNRDVEPADHRINQLEYFQQVGLLQNAYETSPASVATLPDPIDSSVPVSLRARSYLHANCAHCHRRHSGGTSAVELPFETDLAKTHTVGVRPGLGAFGIDDAAIVSPGDPHRSTLFYRFVTSGAARMPRLGSSVVDLKGTELLHEWIRSLRPAVGDGNSAPKGAEADNVASESRGKALMKERDELTKILRQASEDERQRVIARLLATTSDALRLVLLIDTGVVEATIADEIVQRGLEAESAYVRALFERFLPEEAQVDRLGESFEMEEVLSLIGDVDRGAKLFRGEGAARCGDCHKVHGSGQDVGPDLTEISKKYSARELLESIVDPSKKIEPAYVSYVLITTGGTVVTGLLLERNDKRVVLKESNGEVVEVVATDVQALSPQQVSLMPEMLLRDMTAQQAADLLAFLLATTNTGVQSAAPDAGGR